MQAKVKVLHERKLFAVRSDRTAAIKAIRPDATEVKDNVVVLPHTLDACATMRSLGINVPSPILFHYDWPAMFPVANHQKVTAAGIVDNPKFLVLNEQGTGKTISALWAADYLMQLGVVRQALIVAPLSTLECAWASEIFCHIRRRKFQNIHTNSGHESRLKLCASDADFLIVNHHGFERVWPILSKTASVDMIIYDEATTLRNPSTKMFKSMRRAKASNPNLRIVLMTGTPTAGEPTDAWALGHLIDNPNCPARWTDFRQMVMQKVGQFKWVPKVDAAETAHKVLLPCVRFRREDCMDLPPTVYQDRVVPLTNQQKVIYKQMVKHLAVQMQNGQLLTTPSNALDKDVITAANEMVKAMRLVQIASGVVYDTNGRHIALDYAPRLECLKEILAEAEGKIIVYASFRGTVTRLAEDLAKDYEVAKIDGSTPPEQRADIFREFQSDGGLRVLVAHPRTISHGVTLTNASAIVWFMPTSSNETYLQANDRNNRMGKKYSSLVIHIAATKLETSMYRRLKAKQSLQNILLNYLTNQEE